MNSSADAWGILNPSSPSTILTVTLCATGFIASFLTAFWLVAERDRASVRLSQPAAGFTIFFSLALLNGTVSLGLSRPQRPELCVSRMAAVQMSVVSILVAFVVKAWRLYRFSRYQRNNTTARHLSEGQCFSVVLVAIVLHATLVVMWIVFEPVSAVPAAAPTSCDSGGNKYAEVVSMVEFVFIWGLWAYFSTCTIRLEPRLNELNWLSCICFAVTGTFAVTCTHYEPNEVFTLAYRQMAEVICVWVFTMTCVANCVLTKHFGKMRDEEALDRGLQKHESLYSKKSSMTSVSSRGSQTQAPVYHPPAFSEKGSWVGRRTDVDDMDEGDEVDCMPPPQPPPPPIPKSRLLTNSEKKRKIKDDKFALTVRPMDEDWV